MLTIDFFSIYPFRLYVSALFLDRINTSILHNIIKIKSQLVMTKFVWYDSKLMTETQEEHLKNLKLDWPVLTLSGGFLLLFIIASIIDAGFVGNLVNTGFAWSSLNFGAFWQVLMIVTFIIAVFMSLTELGTVRLGDSLKPKFSYFKWFSMIMITLLAGGGVFWAAAEPMYHYLDTPPMFTEMGAEATDVQAGLSAGFLHWGFLAWSILGTLGVVVLMYARKKRAAP